MRGLSIIGTGLAADEAAVAEAACAALRDAGEAPALERIDGGGGGATPYVAARHAGGAIDPEELVARARAADGPVVVATSGGALAPLTERYTVRDLARELGLPVVVAAPAGRDLVNHARLTSEAIRGVGLAVAGVVVTGWPQTPSRVLLDERALLRGSVLLDDVADAARRWLDERPAEAAAVVLEPYEEWEARAVGDPRATPRGEIMAALEAIVAAEGPMRASRAYALYNRAAGGRKLTAVARAPLSSAMYWLARERRVLLTRADDIPWQQDDLVRLPDTPAVRVRELGSRTLEEVPLDEIAELVGRIRDGGGDREPLALKRAVLDAYGLVRLTTRADEYLGLALDLADG